MTDKSYQIGSLTGPVYEFLDQKGTNTPLNLRLKGQYTDNPFSKRLVTQVNPVIESRFTSDKGTTYPRPANKPTARDWVPIGSQLGPKPALVSLISDLASEWRNTDLNVGLLLSPEGRESVMMMGDMALRVANSARALKRGNLDGFFRNLRALPRSSRSECVRRYERGDLSGAFLSAHLGWEPVLKDIYAASAIASPRWKSEQVKAKAGWPDTKVWTKNAKVSFKGEHFGVDSLKARVSKAPTFSQRFGLANPALVAWNLVPLSFVADYFLPIGDTLDAFEFISNNSVERVTYNSYRELWYEVEIPPRALSVTSNNVTYYNRQTYHYRFREVNSTRSPHVLTLRDCLQWNLTIPSSVTRLGTLAALAHQSLIRLQR